MFSKRFNLMLIIITILLLGGVTVAQAAPPWQAPGDGSTLGETLNFDNVKPNLGSVMSDKDDTVEPPDGTVEPPDGTVEPPEGTEEPTGGTDELPDGTVEPTPQHPVATALADYFGVPYEEVMGLHESGYGFGNIARAYFFVNKFGDQLGGMDALQLLETAHGAGGWGKIFREVGIHKNGKPDHAGNSDQDGPPGQNKKGNGDGAELTGQSGGNGNGNGNGQGGGKDKDKGGKGNGKGPKNK